MLLIDPRRASTMRAMRRSPLFRIALLSLAVLSAHTAHATNVRHSFPAAPPCPRKVAAAQPDQDNKPSLQIKRIVRSRHANSHSSSGGPFFFAPAHTRGFLAAQNPAQIAVGRRTADITPQHRLFVLRI